PVGVHVVREAARAADARHEDGVLQPHAEFGEEELHGGEHRVVAAARAPADLLVRLEVLPGQLDRLGMAVAGVAVGGVAVGLAHQSVSSMMQASISEARKWMPLILLSPTTSTSKSIRSSFDSCPRLSSGTRILS